VKIKALLIFYLFCLSTTNQYLGKNEMLDFPDLKMSVCVFMTKNKKTKKEWPSSPLPSKQSWLPPSL